MLVACSPQSQAPAQNPAGDEPVQTQPPADQTPQVELLGQGPQTGLRETALTIQSGSKVHHFTVEVAASPDEQERGLMFRKSVAPDRGMIFPYDPPTDASFWMKNTLIPLDLVFVRPNGTVGRVAPDAVPMSLDPIPSLEPISAVIEIAGGRAAELKIDEGDKVTWQH